MSEKILINDNGKIIEAKGKVLEQLLKDRAEAQEQARLLEAETTKRESDRASAMAKLSKLGLTDDEIASLIP